MVVWLVMPARPSAASTRSSAKRGRPASFVNGDHAVDTRRNCVCADAARIIVATASSAVALTRNRGLRAMPVSMQPEHPIRAATSILCSKDQAGASNERGYNRANVPNVRVAARVPGDRERAPRRHVRARMGGHASTGGGWRRARAPRSPRPPSPARRRWARPTPTSGSTAIAGNRFRRASAKSRTCRGPRATVWAFACW